MPFFSDDGTLSVIQGDAIKNSCQLVDATSTPVDFTDKEIEFRMAPSFGEPHVIIANFNNGGLLADDPANGTIRFDIASAVTATWARGLNVYEIKLIDTDVTYTLIRGNFLVLGEIQ